MRLRHTPAALAARLNHQERALARLKASGPLLGPECIDEADYRARQAAVYAPMTARIDASNPREEWK